MQGLNNDEHKLLQDGADTGRALSQFVNVNHCTLNPTDKTVPHGGRGGPRAPGVTQRPRRDGAHENSTPLHMYSKCNFTYPCLSSYVVGQI